MQHAKLQSKVKGNRHTPRCKSLLGSTRGLCSRALSRLIQGPLFSPDFLDALPLVACVVAIVLCPVVSFHREAFVDFALDIVAVTKGFVDEASGVAFVEGCHDLLAVYRTL